MPVKISARLWDFFILSARVYLAVIFIAYGGAKLSGHQFGITPAETTQPISQLSLFRLYWYLCSFEPFKSFIGISQVVAALLLLWNRTALLGALLLLPIAVNILIADITYLKMEEFYWRLPYYLGLIFLIFWHYRDRMLAAYRALTQRLTTRFSYAWRAWLLLPLGLLAVEWVGRLPQLLYRTSTDPAYLAHYFDYLERYYATLWHYWH
ncbi:DoxX family membrane protein [Hymenobacter sp. HMF4947]|uniref:DoxX family membrane protein n=1 Tax=Hymenobacter ginkgonis TaxID=2682976 RepID=A0A7K1THR2_9BACT|nr:DoxX family membrane protein [Hymenobacter ginkgonis]MVN77701.1 DoxX family membrane protein [Hymenobacter ginkgonis]